MAYVIPYYINKFIADLGEDTIKKNLKMGFKAAGIVPLDCQLVMKRLASGKMIPVHANLDSRNSWVQSSQNFLQESRTRETQPMKIRKKRKLNVPAERGSGALESFEAEGCSFEPEANTPRKGKKIMGPKSDSIYDIEEFSRKILILMSF